MSVATQTPEISETKTTTIWEIDPAHSSAEFSVRHLMVSTVTGRFKALRGTVHVDEAATGDSRVEAEIDAGSIDTGVADRDNHLRSPDFFDAARHPKLVFRSTGLEADGGARGRLHGELTIRGVTRPVSLDVEFLGEIKDPWGNRRRGFAAETTLYRKDFGMTWNQVLDTGGVLVGDKVKISLNVELVEKKQP